MSSELNWKGVHVSGTNTRRTLLQSVVLPGTQGPVRFWRERVEALQAENDWRVVEDQYWSHAQPDARYSSLEACQAALTEPIEAPGA